MNTYSPAETPANARVIGYLTVELRQELLAAALPPLRPAAFFCCVVPPWLALLLLDEPEPDFLPPRLEDPSELEIAAARLLLIPFFRSPSYCLSFLMLEP
jgi:hypothetical protein